MTPPPRRSATWTGSGRRSATTRCNIYGPSYGVTLGLAYLQRYSSHVRTAVLDSGSLLNVPLYQQGAVHDQQVFDQIASRCAGTPACARSYHPAADLAAILAHLNAHPVRVTLPGPGGQHQTLIVTALAFVSFAEGYLGEAQTAVQRPPSCTPWPWASGHKSSPG